MKYKNILLYLFCGVLGGLASCEQEHEQQVDTHPIQQYQLAQAYLIGDGIKKNIDEAITLYQLSAKGGYAVAQNKLGYLYSQGSQVPRDPEQAYYWYSQAAKAGFAVSQFNLAEMYRSGMGTEKDIGAAFIWYQKAALQGYPNAMLRLAESYAGGMGVEQNFIASYAWYQLSIENGINLPDEIPAAIKGRMSIEEFEEAEKRVSELKSKLALAEQ